MWCTIRPRDSKAIEFYAPDGGGYVRISMPGSPGAFGKQICEGGAFLGRALYVGDDYDAFVRACRNWYRAARRKTMWGWWSQDGGTHLQDYFQLR
jgi:hypothetical protein